MEVSVALPYLCAVAEFLDLAGRLPRGEWSAAALAEAVYFRFRSAVTRDVDHLRPLITRLLAESDGNLRGLEHAYLINELALLVNGPAAFTATDIDGKEWDLTGLRGKVASRPIDSRPSVFLWIRPIA